AEGAPVALIDLDPAVHEAARELRERHPVGVLSFATDVTDYAGLRREAGEVRARLGRVDHVVHAAAVGSGKYGFPFWSLDTLPAAPAGLTSPVVLADLWLGRLLELLDDSRDTPQPRTAHDAVALFGRLRRCDPRVDRGRGAA